MKEKGRKEGGEENEEGETDGTVVWLTDGDLNENGRGGTVGIITNCQPVANILNGTQETKRT